MKKIKTEFETHKKKVADLAELLTNRQTYGKPMYAIDVNRWGINAPFSDPENSTIYRDSIEELAYDSFVGDDEEIEHTHYPNAPYQSIFDY